MSANRETTQKNTDEQPRIEIIGDRTVLYFSDGRTSVLHGTSREDVTSAAAPLPVLYQKPLSQRDSLTRVLALGLSVLTGVRAAAQIATGASPRRKPAGLQRFVSELMASITLRAHRRPQQAPSHERDTAGPSEAAYSGTEIPSG